MDLLYNPDANYSHARTTQPQRPRELLLECTLYIFIWIFILIKGFYIPQRYVLTFMGFLGLVMAYSMRLSLSVAITQMVPPPILNMANLTTANGDAHIVCPYVDENYIQEHFDYPAMFDQYYSVILHLCIHFSKLFSIILLSNILMAFNNKCVSRSTSTVFYYVMMILNFWWENYRVIRIN